MVVTAQGVFRGAPKKNATFAADPDSLMGTTFILWRIRQKETDNGEEFNAQSERALFKAGGRYAKT